MAMFLKPGVKIKDFGYIEIVSTSVGSSFTAPRTDTSEAISYHLRMNVVL
jgi:hypothetical protein